MLSGGPFSISLVCFVMCSTKAYSAAIFYLELDFLLKKMALFTTYTLHVGHFVVCFNLIFQ